MGVNYPLEQARAELQLFATGGKRNLSQSIFRSVFFNTREHVLGKNATMRLSFEETVVWATEFVRRDDPRFAPQLA